MEPSAKLPVLRCKQEGPRDRDEGTTRGLGFLVRSARKTIKRRAAHQKAICAFRTPTRRLQGLYKCSGTAPLPPPWYLHWHIRRLNLIKRPRKRREARVSSEGSEF